MRFVKRTVAVGILALVVIIGAIMMAASISAQTRHQRTASDMFRLFGAGSEIGVSVRELTDDDMTRARRDRASGVYVLSVREESPAARAGVRSGDIIVTFDGERVRGVRHFSRLVLESPAGRAVRAEIVREGVSRMVDVTPETSGRFALPLPEIRENLERGLRSLPPGFDLEWPGGPRAVRTRLGISMTPLTDQLGTYFGVEEGVLVSAVEAGSPAADAGLRAGDIVTAIDGQPVRSPGDVFTAALNAAPGATLDVRLVRDRTEMNVKITIARRQPGGTRQIPI